MNVNDYSGVGRLADNVLYTPAAGSKQSRAMGRLIINRRYPSKTPGEPTYDVIPFVAWGKRADALAQYTHKGKELYIKGEIRTRYVRGQTKQDNRLLFECQISEMQFGHDSETTKAQKAIKALHHQPETLSPQMYYAIYQTLVTLDPSLVKGLKMDRSQKPADKVTTTPTVNPFPVSE